MSDGATVSESVGTGIGVSLNAARFVGQMVYDGYTSGEHEAEAWDEARHEVEAEIASASRVADALTDAHERLVEWLNGSFATALAISSGTVDETIAGGARVEDGYVADELLAVVEARAADRATDGPAFDSRDDEFDVTERFDAGTGELRLAHRPVTESPVRVQSLVADGGRVRLSAVPDDLVAVDRDTPGVTIDGVAATGHVLVTYRTRSAYAACRRLLDHECRRRRLLMLARGFLTEHVSSALGGENLAAAIDQMGEGVIVRRAHVYADDPETGASIGNARPAYDDDKLATDADATALEPGDDIRLPAPVSLDDIAPLCDALRLATDGTPYLQVAGSPGTRFVPVADVDLSALPAGISVLRSTWATGRLPVGALPVRSDGTLLATVSRDGSAAMLHPAETLPTGTRVRMVSADGRTFQRGEYVLMRAVASGDQRWIACRDVDRSEVGALSTLALNTLAAFGREWVGLGPDGRAALLGPGADADRTDVGAELLERLDNAMFELEPASEIVHSYRLLTSFSRTAAISGRRAMAMPPVEMLVDRARWSVLTPEARAVLEDVLTPG